MTKVKLTISLLNNPKMKIDNSMILGVVGASDAEGEEADDDGLNELSQELGIFGINMAKRSLKVSRVKETALIAAAM